jgi:hypothetical protein
MPGWPQVKFIELRWRDQPDTQQFNKSDSEQPTPAMQHE